MRFSRFEPKGRLKQQIRFQTTFLLTNRHSHQIKATRRHTHIGSTAGKTTIRSGGDTSLKGAQIIGKGIGLDAQSLRIRSVQDTETYQGKQQNGNVQVTLGYGLSASGSYSQSKIRADHASVTGQSGIYAGEDGYQIKVGDNTDLKGGIITSGKSAEDKGKNLFQTATLTHSDIQNHSRYEGKSFGIGASVAISGESMGQNRPADSGPGIRLIDVSKGQNNNNAIGYGSDGDSKNSTTRSGINTRNIHITDEAGQLARTGRTAKETEARIYTGIDTETVDQHSGRLKNSFDKDAVAKEINLQREVTQEFGKNAAQATAAVSDKLGNTQSYERYQAAKTLLEAELQNTDSETEKAAIRATLGQVNAYLAENQSRYDTWKEGGIGRSILHGAAGGLTTGSLGGILAGSGTSLAAPYLDKAAENLGPAGKAAVNALGGAAIGYAAGGNAGTAAVGANVDWNNRQLHPKETALADKYAEALKREVEKREGRKISSREAAMRIRRQILRWVDKDSQDSYTDQSVISLIGMKGEDKALGYTWDYRDYGARNPQAYNDPKLFEEYRRQDKPEYRNLTWLHSGTKDTKIRQEERKNEEFALNVTDILTGVIPNPRVNVAVRAGIRNLGNIKPTVTGSDPLLAGVGNIRIPANGNVAKGDRIPDTALASKSHQKNDLGVSKGQDLGQAHTAPSTDQKALYIREYLKDIQAQTGYRIEPNQRIGLFEYIRTHGTVKPSQQELARRRAEFGKNRDALIREWEKNTGKKWPTYTEPVISSKTGRTIKPTGSKYDAHHIQPLENNGGNIWQNITPARYPEQHQGGIHRADGPLRNLQKHLDR